MTQLVSSTLIGLFDSNAPLNSFDLFLQQQLFSLLSTLATDASELAHFPPPTASFITYVCTCEQRRDKLVQLNKRTLEYLSPPASTESAECASYLNRFHGHDWTVLFGLVKFGLQALADDDFIIAWLKDTVYFITKFCTWYQVVSPPMSGIIELWQDRLIQMYESVKPLYRHIVKEERVFKCLLPMVDQLLSATAPESDVLVQTFNILQVAGESDSPSVWPISRGLPVISNVLRYHISIQKSQVSEYNWNQFNDSVPDAANTSIQVLRSRFHSVLNIIDNLLKFLIRPPSSSSISSKFDSYATELSTITAHLFVLHNPTAFWSSQSLKEYSTFILTNVSELINASVKAMVSLVARDIVTRYVKPFFMQKISMRKGVDFDSFHEEPIWKSDRPECISILEAVIDYVEFPHMSDLVPFVIPPIISLIEYFDVAIKLRGVICLAHVLNESDKSVLRRTGLAAVFLDRLFMTLTFRTDSSHIPLLKATLPVTISAISAAYVKDSKEWFQELEKLMNEVIKSLEIGLGFDNFKAKTMYLNTCSTLIDMLGLVGVKYITKILPVLLETLSYPVYGTFHHSMKNDSNIIILLNCSADVLGKTLGMAYWTRLATHSPDILRAIATCWYRYIQSPTTSSNFETEKQLLELKGKLLIIARELGVKFENEIKDACDMISATDNETFRDLIVMKGRPTESNVEIPLK